MFCRAAGLYDFARDAMTVCRHFTDDKSVIGLADGLSEYEPEAHMRRHLALQVRQRKRLNAVAPVGRTEDGKQCLVLGDRQDLTVAERPTFRREAEAKAA